MADNLANDNRRTVQVHTGKPMLARYLKLTLWLLSTFAAIVAVSLWAFVPPMALLLVVAIMLSFSVVIGLQCAALLYFNRHDPAPKASKGQLLHAWWAETWAAARVFYWWQPFRSENFPDATTPLRTDAPIRGVVLVHGFICNRGLWTDWYPELGRRNIPFVAVNLEPVFGSIDTYIAVLDRAVLELQEATGLPPLVIGHSMGGVAVRAWMRACNDDNRVHRIVTIGSPHHGTKVGAGLPQLAVIENARQMAFGSAWLAALAAQETPERRKKFVCFYSNCDNIVAPASSATLADADNRHRSGVPHLALALDPSVRTQALALL